MEFCQSDFADTIIKTTNVTMNSIIRLKIFIVTTLEIIKTSYRILPYQTKQDIMYVGHQAYLIEMIQEPLA